MKLYFILIFSLIITVSNAQTYKTYKPKRQSPTPKPTEKNNENNFLMDGGEIEEFIESEGGEMSSKSILSKLEKGILISKLLNIKTESNKYTILACDSGYGLYDTQTKKLAQSIIYQNVINIEGDLFFLSGTNFNTIMHNDNFVNCDLCERITKSNQKNKYLVESKNGMIMIYDAQSNQLSKLYQKKDTAITNLDFYKKQSNVTDALSISRNIKRVKNSHGKFELVDSSLKKVIQKEFDNYFIAFPAFHFGNQFHFPLLNGKYGIYRQNEDESFTVISECNIDTIYSLGSGYSIVRNGHEILTDFDFKEIYSEKFKSKDFVKYVDENNHYTNYLIVNDEKGAKMIDMSGNIIWALKKITIHKFELPDHMSQLPYLNLLEIKNKKGDLGLVDFNGNEVLPSIYKSITNINNQWIKIIDKNNKTGIFDGKAKAFIIKPDCDLLFTTNKTIYFKKNEKLYQTPIKESSTLDFNIGEITEISIKIDESSEKKIITKSGNWSTYTGKINDGSPWGAGLIRDNKILTPPIFKLTYFAMTLVDSISKNFENCLGNDKLILKTYDQEFLFDLKTSQFLFENIESEFNFANKDTVYCHALDINFIYDFKTNKKEDVSYISYVDYFNRFFDKNNNFLEARVKTNSYKIHNISANRHLALDKYLSIRCIDNNLLVGIYGNSSYSDLINKNGKVIFTGEIYRENVQEQHKMIIAAKDEKFGIIDFNGNVILDFKYDYLSGKDNDSTYIFKENNNYGLVNNKNTIVKPATHVYIERISSAAILYKDFKIKYQQATYIIKSNQGCSLVSHTGSLLIPNHKYINNIKEYDGFPSSYFSVGQSDKEFKIYNNSGKVISNEIFEEITSRIFRNMLICKLNNKYVVYDIEKQKIISNGFEILFRMNQDYYGIKNNTEYEVDISGNLNDKKI